MPVTTAAFASLRRAELADATSQLSVLQRLGGSIGTAAIAVVLQRALGNAHSLTAAAAAYGTAYWWSAVMTMLAIIPCLILMRTERRAPVSAGDQARPCADPLANPAAG
jgi:hypothetical protein